MAVSTPMHPDQRHRESSRYGQYPCGFAVALVGRLDADPAMLFPAGPYARNSAGTLRVCIA